MGISAQKNEPTSHLKEMLLAFSDFVRLLDDPNALASQIKLGLQLTDEEQKKSEEGRSYISAAKQMKSEIDLSSHTINEQKKELDEKHRNNNRTLDELKSESAKLAKLKADLDAKDRDYSEKDAQHKRERDELDKYKQDIESRHHEVKKREVTVTEVEAQQKEQIEKLRQAAKGL